jgi:uncharacterized membrane protein
MKRLLIRKRVIDLAKTTTEGTGLRKETAAALSTLLGITLVIPALLIIFEKDDFVRFWAFQSIIVYIGLILLDYILRLTVYFGPLTPLVFVAGVILWLLMTYRAWQGDRWKVPFVGKLVDKLLYRA